MPHASRTRLGSERLDLYGIAATLLAVSMPTALTEFLGKSEWVPTRPEALVRRRRAIGVLGCLEGLRRRPAGAFRRRLPKTYADCQAYVKQSLADIAIDDEAKEYVLNACLRQPGLAMRPTRRLMMWLVRAETLELLPQQARDPLGLHRNWTYLVIRLAVVPLTRLMHRPVPVRPQGLIAFDRIARPRGS